MPPQSRRYIAVLLLTAATASCNSMRPASCPAGQDAAVQDLLYFGTETPSGHVSAQEWADFLAAAVTPRFPDGLTTWQASGQWRSASGTLVQEPSYVVSLVHPPNAASDAAVAEVVDAYKRRFQQEAVLRVRSDVCKGL